MKLPPDPEKLNKLRSEQAKDALDHFVTGGGLSGKHTGVALAVAMADLICNLAHLCDRRKIALADVISRAAACYKEETSNQGGQL